MRAPWAVAPRASDHTVFQASIDASGTVNTRLMSGLSRGSLLSASAGLISATGSAALRQPSRNASPYAGSSSGVTTNMPPVSSMQSGITRRRIAFSATHSSAAIGSFTTYRPPEWSRPWKRPLVPSARSARSTSVTSNPRSAASHATPAPVAPPPITRTSVSRLAIRRAYSVAFLSGRRTSGASGRGTRRSGPHGRWWACRGAWRHRERYPVASGPRRERSAVGRYRGCPGHGWRERSCTARYPQQGSTQHFFFLVSVRLEPVEGPRHGLLPERVVLVALGRVHARLPALVLGPVLAQILLVTPEARREPGRVRRAERGRLGHLRPDDRHAEEVGLELHEQIVLHHAAVDLQRLERDARVRVHGLDHLAALVGRGLQRRAGDVAGVHVAGQARDDATRIGLPVRREQARERRHHVAAAVVLDRLGQLLDLGR